MEVMVRTEDVPAYANGTTPKNGRVQSTVESFTFLGRTVRLDVGLGTADLSP